MVVAFSQFGERILLLHHWFSNTASLHISFVFSEGNIYIYILFVDPKFEYFDFFFNILRKTLLKKVWVSSLLILYSGYLMSEPFLITGIKSKPVQMDLLMLWSRSTLNWLLIHLIGGVLLFESKFIIKHIIYVLQF